MLCFGMRWTLSDPEVRDSEMEGAGVRILSPRVTCQMLLICCSVDQGKTTVSNRFTFTM